MIGTPAGRDLQRAERRRLGQDLAARHGRPVEAHADAVADADRERSRRRARRAPPASDCGPGRRRIGRPGSVRGGRARQSRGRHRVGRPRRARRRPAAPGRSARGLSVLALPSTRAHLEAAGDREVGARAAIRAAHAQPRPGRDADGLPADDLAVDLERAAEAGAGDDSGRSAVSCGPFRVISTSGVPAGCRPVRSRAAPPRDRPGPTRPCRRGPRRSGRRRRRGRAARARPRAAPAAAAPAAAARRARSPTASTPSLGTRRTRSPAASRNGSGRCGSYSACSAVPRMFQPPGDAGRVDGRQVHRDRDGVRRQRDARVRAARQLQRRVVRGEERLARQGADRDDVVVRAPCAGASPRRRQAGGGGDVGEVGAVVAHRQPDLARVSAARRAGGADPVDDVVAVDARRIPGDGDRREHRMHVAHAGRPASAGARGQGPARRRSGRRACPRSEGGDVRVGRTERPASCRGRPCGGAFLEQLGG